MNKMIKIMYKLLAFFVIIIFLTEIVYSFNASSNDYSLDSYHTGLAGGNISNASYESRFSSVYQQSGGKGENGNYSANIGFFSQPEFCGDGYCNAGEDCSTCPVDCGTCPSVPSEVPSAPAAAGAACTYDWVCSEWYPEPCPSEGIQKRVCVNRGTCTGTVGMPSLIRTCTPEFIPPSEPLFDIFLKIPFGKKWISRGDTIEAQIELINVGNITTIDVFFKYWIVDENNRLIFERQETRAIGERERFSVWFPISEDIKPGIYKIYVHITYDSKVALAGDSFEVFESRFLITRRIVFLSLIVLSVLSGLIIIIIKILRRRKERKRKVKQRGVTGLTRRLLRAEKKRLRKIKRKRRRKMRELRRAERKRKRRYRIKRREREREIRSMEKKRRLKKVMRKLKMILVPEKERRVRKFRIRKLKRKIKIPKHKKFKIKAKRRRKKEISHEEIERLRKKVYEELLKKTIEMKQSKKTPQESHEDLDLKIGNLKEKVRKKGIKEAEIHKKRKYKGKR